MSSVGSAVSALAMSFGRQAPANYVAMFNNVSDPAASAPAVAPPMTRTWGGFRLAAWSWSGMSDVGPVIIATPLHAYGVAQSNALINFRNITTI
jgi:hypothetical protein